MNVFYLNCPSENPVLTEFIKLEFITKPAYKTRFIDVLFCDTELNWYQCTNRPGFDMHDSAVLHGTL